MGFKLGHLMANVCYGVTVVEGISINLTGMVGLGRPRLCHVAGCVGFLHVFSGIDSRETLSGPRQPSRISQRI